MKTLNLTEYPSIAQQHGLLFYHFPIKDGSIPPETEIEVLIPTLVTQLAEGVNILVHCRLGLGRAGTICACCLGHFGYDGKRALNIVRHRRPGAIQTKKQEKCVDQYCLQLLGY